MPRAHRPTKRAHVPDTFPKATAIIIQMCVPYTHVHKQSKRRTHVRTSAVRSARSCVHALNPSHKSSPGCGACMAYQLAASSFMDGFRIYSPGLIAKRRRVRSKYLSILSHTIQNRNHIRKSSQHTHTHTRLRTYRTRAHTSIVLAAIANAYVNPIWCVALAPQSMETL